MGNMTAIEKKGRCLLWQNHFQKVWLIITLRQDFLQLFVTKISRQDKETKVRMLSGGGRSFELPLQEVWPQRILYYKNTAAFTHFMIIPELIFHAWKLSLKKGMETPCLAIQPQKEEEKLTSGYESWKKNHSLLAVFPRLDQVLNVFKFSWKYALGNFRGRGIAGVVTYRIG